MSIMASSENGLYLVLDGGGGGGGGGGKPAGSRGGGGARKGGRLFLGTQKAAQDLSLLQRYEVSKVVCVGTPAFHRQQQQQQGKEDADGDSGDHNKSQKTNSSSADGRLMYLEVPILDLPSENLLERLHECVGFIESGMRRGESVLVNCVYAQSRSAAVVVAYLMEWNGMSLPEAIDKAREAQPTVHINPGFEAQLALFRDLGFEPPPGKRPVEDESTATAVLAEEPYSKCTSTMAGATYRWFLFATTLKRGDLCRWAAPGGGGAENHVPSTGSTYRCKSCRSALFCDSNVLDHLHPIVLAASDSIYASFSRYGDGSSWMQARDAAAAAATSSLAKKEVHRAKGRHQPRARPGTGGTVLIDNGRGKGVAPSAAERCNCTSVFTEALDWVGIVKGKGSRDFDHQTSDKISCPGRKGAAPCGRKLGAWSLDGSSCSCGRVVKPAIQFTLSRIERVQAF